MLEREVEQHFKDECKAQGWMPYKFVSPARRNVPDQILLRPIPKRHQEIVARYLRFVELKRPGEKPRSGQLREHKRLQALGYVVEVLDSKVAVDGFINSMGTL